MKIRHILLILTAFLGVALLVAVSVQIRNEVLEYQTAQRMVASNAVRERLLLATDALAAERSQTYALLINPDKAGEKTRGVDEVRRQVDDLLQSAERTIEETRTSLTNSDGSLTLLSGIRQAVKALRDLVDASLNPDESRRSRELAPRWFQETSRLIEDLQSSRLTLLQRERPLEPTLRTEANLRTYGGILSESIARNQALMTHVLASPQGSSGLDLDAISRNAGRAGLVWELIDGQPTASLSEPVKAAIASAREDFRSTLAPLQQSLLVSLLSRVPPRLDSDDWYEITGRSLNSVAMMQQELLSSSRTRLQAELRRAERSVALWTTLLALGVGAVIGSALVVRRRVVRPLEELSRTMLRLADHDLTTPLPRDTRSDELGAMSDALRVFKANAIKRERTQNEKQMLHARLRDAYRQLRKDLEAAAVIQSTMLPPPSTLGSVRHRGLFRPSSLIAGDTYNVVRRNDGGVGFFQVDVAGHGAPAALVSVACHHALSQAILTRTQGTPLEEIASQINGDWPEDLPYFTMILGEVDPHSQRASIIQAGHPPPLVIRVDGTVEALGDGGFPVGMIAAATYERLEFEFEPGDRLLIYSDGLIEAEDAKGEAFSEARLRQVIVENAGNPTSVLLEALDGAVRNWRGSETLEDDLSVLMLERLAERTPTHAVH